MGLVTTDEARIQARYPKRSPIDYVLGIGAGLALLAAVAIVLLSGLKQANPPVAAMVRGFEVVSPTRLDVELVVQRRDPADPVTCDLYAQAESYETVAEATIEIPPGTDVLTSVDVTMATIKEATAVSIKDCSLAD